KNFSRTVVMQSNIGDHIDPAGWFPWDGDFALDTLYYAEYMNFGLGSDTSKRVNWTGYHVLTDPLEAKQFTVGEFIQGQEWLEDAG
ncbi:pectinesterase family protein, partial [Mycobacterium kansasii]